MEEVGLVELVLRPPLPLEEAALPAQQDDQEEEEDAAHSGEDLKEER